MRLVALSVSLLALLAFGAGAACAAEDGVSLTSAGTPQFPDRAYRLTVPERRGMDLRDIQVTENGDPVSKLGLTSADGQAVGEFGTILVIDASKSMHGSAIHSAMAAAREFARQRSGGQQIGVIVFNKTPQILLKPTDDQRAIDAVLSKTPELAAQTHIFDAVSTALDLLDEAHFAAGSIVVLSDGADSGSVIAADAVTKRADGANASLLTVGLRSGAFDSSALQNLAAGGRGRYTAARSVGDLRGIFHKLGAQLASDYLIRYRSFAKPGSEVTVAVRINGVTALATDTYTVSGGATFVQIEPGLWTSGLGAALTGLLFALLLGLALWILLARRRQGPTVRQRVRGFVSMPNDVSPAGDSALTGRTVGGAERSLERTKWWAAFKQDVDIARIEMDPVRIVAITAVSTLVLMFLLVRVTGIPLIGLFALAIPWGVRTLVGIKLERQRALFVDQLPDTLQGAASAIRAGHGLVAALSLVAEDAPEPSRTEFLRVVADEGLGVPLEDALSVVQQRMNSREVLQIGLVAQIQREAGGNMAEVLDRITETLRQRAELRRMVKALTAQGRLSRWVVTALPLVLLLVISVLNPTYIQPLFTTGLGLVMLGLAGVMMFMGSLFIGKIVNFKV